MKRVIPCLLLDGDGLVKTIKFKKPTYVGDPINTVRIFNEKEVDELVFLDIRASEQGRGPNFDLLMRIVNESFIPLGYGGGISCREHADRLFQMGVEKVIVNTAFHERPGLISELAAIYGVQAIVVSLDVRRTWRGKLVVRQRRNAKGAQGSLESLARRAEELGAGEILVSSIDRDGTMQGYDLEAVQAAACAVRVPVICCGGAGQVEDLAAGIRAGASAVGAGSLFVFHGPHRAVLISYPTREERNYLSAVVAEGTGAIDPASRSQSKEACDS